MDFFSKKKKNASGASEAESEESRQAGEPQAANTSQVEEKTQEDAAEALEAETDADETESPSVEEKQDYAEEIAGVVKKLNIDEKQRDELSADLAESVRMILAENADGGLGETTLLLLAMGLDYSRAVEKAEAEGYVRGRNERIEEHLLTKDDSDGIPHPGCGQGGSAPRKESIFELARKAR